MQPSRGSCGGALRRARGEQLGLVRALQGCGVKFLSQSRIKKSSVPVQNSYDQGIAFDSQEKRSNLKSQGPSLKSTPVAARGCARPLAGTAPGAQQGNGSTKRRGYRALYRAWRESAVHHATPRSICCCRNPACRRDGRTHGTAALICLLGLLLPVDAVRRAARLLRQRIRGEVEGTRLAGPRALAHRSIRLGGGGGGRPHRASELDRRRCSGAARVGRDPAALRRCGPRA
jgi:hypothetical protein